MIPTALLTIIAAGVDAMATPTYNFSYGAVDVVPPVDTGAPLVYLELPEAVGISPSESVVGRYTQDAGLAFRVLAPYSASASSDAQASKVADDIKELMHALEPSLQAAGMSFADLVSIQKQYRLVRAYPVQVTVTFNIRFRQLRAGG